MIPWEFNLPDHFPFYFFLTVSPAGDEGGSVPPALTKQHTCLEGINNYRTIALPPLRLLKQLPLIVLSHCKYSVQWIFFFSIKAAQRVTPAGDGKTSATSPVVWGTTPNPLHLLLLQRGQTSGADRRRDHVQSSAGPKWAGTLAQCSPGSTHINTDK